MQRSKFDNGKSLGKCTALLVFVSMSTEQLATR